MVMGASRDRSSRRTVVLGLVGLGVGLGVELVTGCGSRATEVTFAAAASLRQVLPKLIDAFEKLHPGPHVLATYGASGDLAKQVEGGAPIDGVLFASKKPVDHLASAGVVSKARVVATNRLVLIGPREKAGGAPRPKLTFATLSSLPANEKLAIGDPGAVPAGQYAKDALVALAEWDALQSRLVLGGDVSAVLAYARRGEVSAAIVYETEVRGIDDVVVLDRAEGSWAPRAEVVGAVVSAAKGASRADELIAFSLSPEGQAILRDHGFGPP